MNNKEIDERLRKADEDIKVIREYLESQKEGKTKGKSDKPKYEDFITVFMRKKDKEMLEKKAAEENLPLFIYCYNIIMKALEKPINEDNKRFTLNEIKEAIRKLVDDILKK